MPQGGSHGIGSGKGEIDENDNDDEKGNGSNGQCCDEPHDFLYDIEPQIFVLKPDVMLKHLNELPYCLYIFVSGKHVLSLFSNISCGVLDIVGQIDNLFAREIDVVLLAEIVNSICYFFTSVCSFFRCDQET